ncbi:MAG: hypothetical protein ACJ8CR_23980, partial [Roseiflexaceae bacterium]
LVVALSTVFYVLLTRRLVLETIKLRRAGTEPDIAVYLERRERGSIDMVIRNIGSGPAYNLVLDLEPENDTVKTLRSYPFLNELKYIPPEHAIRARFGRMSAGGVIAEAVIVKLTYYNKAREKQVEVFHLNADGYNFMAATELQSWPEMISALQAIAAAAGRSGTRALQ